MPARPAINKTEWVLCGFLPGFPFARRAWYEIGHYPTYNEANAELDKFIGPTGAIIRTIYKKYKVFKRVCTYTDIDVTPSS